MNLDWRGRNGTRSATSTLGRRVDPEPPPIVLPIAHVRSGYLACVTGVDRTCVVRRAGHAGDRTGNALILAGSSSPSPRGAIVERCDHSGFRSTPSPALG